MLPSHLMGDSLTGDRNLGGERAWNSHATLICPYLANSDHQTTFGGLEPLYKNTTYPLEELSLSCTCSLYIGVVDLKFPESIVGRCVGDYAS